MAIQLRRGDYEDFDKTKMQEGELAIVTSNDPNTESGCATYVSYASGNQDKVKRLVHEEDYNKDFENLGAKMEAEVKGLFEGVNLDETVVKKAFDELGINGESLYNEIQEVKPNVIGENTEGDWKRATIVIPELQFKYYAESTSVPTSTSAAISLSDYISDDIHDAIVISVLAQQKTYSGPVFVKRSIGCGYCARYPDGNYYIVLYDRDSTKSDFTAFTVIDILYKTNQTEIKV